MDMRYTALVMLFSLNVMLLLVTFFSYARFLPRRIPQLGKCLVLVVVSLVSAVLTMLGIILPQGRTLTVVVTLHVLVGYLLNTLLVQILLCMMGFNGPRHLRWQRVLYALPLLGIVLAATSPFLGLFVDEVTKTDPYSYVIAMSLPGFVLAIISSAFILLIFAFAIVAIIRKSIQHLDTRVILALSGSVLVPSLIKHAEGVAETLTGYNLRLSSFMSWIPVIVICYIYFGYLRSARYMAIKRTSEIYVVFDKWGTAVDVNPAGRSFFESHGLTRLPTFTQFRELLSGANEAENLDPAGEFSLQSGDTTRFYRAAAFQLSGGLSQYCGDGFIIREVTEYHERMDELNTMAVVDGLTGVQNRRSFDNNAPLAVSRAERSGAPLTALMIDLDLFKSVNDTYGHSVGDEVLQALCQVCKANLRRHDVLYRYGGEEFVVICEETGEYEGHMMADRLQRAVAEQPFSTSMGDIPVTVSIGGCALRAQPGDTIARWVKLADQNMYKAKQTGRNRVVFLSE